MDARACLSERVHPNGVVPIRAPLWTVQVLRGIAALLVVSGHCQSAVFGVTHGAGGTFARSTLLPWGAGVDLFFVISGFIIVHASGRLFGTPGATIEFLRRRLIRIVPLYWLVTTLFLLLLAAASAKGGDRFPGIGGIAASYAFVPVDTYGDGHLFPVFDLGWTLNYEMLFYALLAVAIALPRRIALGWLGLSLGLLVLGGTAISAPSAAWFWTRPIILDFGFGVVVATMLGRGVRLPGVARATLAVAAIAALLLDPGHVFDGPVGVTVGNDLPRVLFAGLPGAVLMAAAVLGTEPRMPRLALPLTAIGDASYSLYLLHPIALIAMEKLAQKLAFVRSTPPWLLVAATFLVAIGLAIAGYRWIELPMTKRLGRRRRSRTLRFLSGADGKTSC